jgi:hypothetical protein
MIKHLVTSAIPASPAFDEMREKLDSIRANPAKKPTHIVNRQVWETVEAFVLSRGRFCRDNHPKVHHSCSLKYVQDSGGCIIVGDGPAMHEYMRRLGLLAGEPHTTLIIKNLVQVAYLSPLLFTRTPNGEYVSTESATAGAL